MSFRAQPRNLVSYCIAYSVRIQIPPLRDAAHHSGRNDTVGSVIPSEVEESGPRAISIVPAVAEITPLRIFLFDQTQFLFAAPVLDLLFSGDAVRRIIEGFKINKRFHVVTIRESLGLTGLVFMDSPTDVVCESDVKCSRLVGHDVDVVCSARCHVRDYRVECLSRPETFDNRKPDSSASVGMTCAPKQAS